MARILLVDDDINLLQMVKLMLQRVGHDVTTSKDGEEGIVLAGQVQPDLAIIDVMMPGLSGYDVVRRLRESPRTARIPVIILTARSQPMDKHMALEAGANAFLSKPVTVQELVDRVNAVLRAGVDFRVHTGLLTEPVKFRSEAPASEVQPDPTPPAAEPHASTPARPSTARKPIGAEDTVTTPAPGMIAPVTVVTGLRGGTGSTTVAVNIALLLGGRGRRACLIDLSLSSGHVPLHLHLASPPHWGSLLDAGPAPEPAAVKALVSQNHPSGVAVLAAPPVPSIRTLSPEAMQVMLGSLGQAYQYLVIDLPQFDPAGLAALKLARTVVVVMSDDTPSLQTTGQFLIALQEAGLDMGRVRVVLSHVRPARDIPAETIQRALKRPLSAEIPFEPNQVTAVRRGVPLVAADPESLFAKSLQQLVRTMVSG